MSIDWIQRSQSVKYQIRNLIDGKKSGPRGTALEKYSPRDGGLLGTLGAGDPADVDEAVNVSRTAVAEGRWSELPVSRRKAILFRLAELVDRHRDELALMESLDVGKPISDALAFDVPTVSAVIRANAEVADKISGKTYAVDSTSLSYQLIRPVGVVAGIVGWNFPLVLAAGKVAPALAAGNCIVLKPSEVTSLSAGRLAELALEAGVPPGVFNVIHGDGRVGGALATHPGVDLITFTGSTRTGKHLLAAAGHNSMKRVLLECGGKAPNIVFEDCPRVQAVADAVVARAFWNQGQVCTASSRLLVHESIKRDFLNAVIEKVASLAPGDPLDPSTTFGPVVCSSHRDKVLNYVRAGSEDGGRIVYQGEQKPPNTGGYFVPPVIFDDIKASHRIAQEEIFGPVLSVMTFHDEREAIQLANSTIYGLSAIAWTKDLGRAHRITHGIRAGWITVNAAETPKGGPGVGVLSIGGLKDSGIGTEGGLEGLKEYTERSAIQIFI